MITNKEATAGASRRAIATIGMSTIVDTPRRKTTEAITTAHSGFRCTSVIDTPMRRVDVVEFVNSGNLRIRQTEYGHNNRGASLVSVTEIQLDYHEADALTRVIDSLTPPDEVKQ